MTTAYEKEKAEWVREAALWKLTAEGWKAVAESFQRDLMVLSTQHSRPDSDHPNEQRETDERRCFVGDCEQDGIAGVNSAEVIQHAPGIWARGPVMIPAGTTATAATAGEAQTTLEARWPGDSLHKTERT